MDFKTIITSHSNYFVNSSIVGDILRTIGWGIICFLKSICDAVQGVFDAAYSALNFLDYPAFKTFVSSFSIFITVILSISFLAIALILIFSEKKPPVLKNALIGLTIIYFMPSVITNLNSGVLSVKNEMVTSSFAGQTIASNISDLSYIANQSFNFDSTVANTLGNNTDLTKVIDVTAYIKSSSFSTQTAKDVFNHYAVLDETTGQETWKEIGSKGLFDIFNPPYYYRYYVHWFEIILALLANILVYLFSAYAVVRMTYELITTKISAALMSVEIASGQKTMKLLEYFFCEYVILIAIPVLLKLFTIWQAYINTLGINGITRGILIVIGGLVVMDGPSIVEKLFGFDMGISSGSQKAMSFVRTMQQARMQHHMSQARTNKGLHRNMSSSMRFMSGKNAAGSEPNINGSGNMGSANAAMGNTGNHTGAASEPNINKNSNSNTQSNTSHASGGAMSEPNINNSSESAVNNSDGTNGNSSLNNSINNASGGAVSEPNIGNSMSHSNNKAGGSRVFHNSRMGAASGGAISRPDINSGSGNFMNTHNSNESPQSNVNNENAASVHNMSNMSGCDTAINSGISNMTGGASTSPDINNGSGSSVMNSSSVTGNDTSNNMHNAAGTEPNVSSGIESSINNMSSMGGSNTAINSSVSNMTEGASSESDMYNGSGKDVMNSGNTTGVTSSEPDINNRSGSSVINSKSTTGSTSSKVLNNSNAGHVEPGEHNVSVKAPNINVSNNNSNKSMSMKSTEVTKKDSGNFQQNRKIFSEKKYSINDIDKKTSKKRGE